MASVGLDLHLGHTYLRGSDRSSSVSSAKRASIAVDAVPLPPAGEGEAGGSRGVLGAAAAEGVAALLMVVDGFRS